jgi:hypothetical protein
VNPHGTEIVGNARKLNGLVLRQSTASFAMMSSNVVGNALVSGDGTGVVSVNRTSTWMKRAGAFRRS